MRRHISALACFCLAVMLAGCSAGGVQQQVTAGTRSASCQTATATFIQQWAQTLWGLVTNPGGAPTVPSGPPIFNPDGSMSLPFAAGDGTTFLMTPYQPPMPPPFPPGVPPQPTHIPPPPLLIPPAPPPPFPATYWGTRLDITSPDGSEQTVWQSAPQGSPFTVFGLYQLIESATGPSVEYSVMVNPNGTPFDASDDTITLAGSATLPGGLTQIFTAVTDAGTMTLHSEQSDGSEFDMVAPLAPPLNKRPDFSQPTTGTYSTTEVTVDFTLTSTAAAPGRWGRLMTDFGGGLTGDFSLNADFSGEGQLLQDGEVIALLSWTATGETDVAFVSADSSATSAAGAAIDFLTNRWQTLSALGAPGA